jgi:hypothetical protein
MSELERLMHIFMFIRHYWKSPEEIRRIMDYEFGETLILGLLENTEFVND